MRKPHCLVLVIVSVQLLLTSFAQAAPPAFIPPKFKGIILEAPVPDYPMEAANRFTVETQGIYRLKFRPQTGIVDTVSVLKPDWHCPSRTGVWVINALHVLAAIRHHASGEL